MYAANFFNIFCQKPVIIAIIVSGYIFINKKIFSDALMLILFTVAFSALLKIIFKVPLNPSLGLVGYAFPSGHMLSSFVFYGTLFLGFKNKISRAVIIIILIGVAYSLIELGFHDLKDILGAVFFGSLTLFCFYKVFKNMPHLYWVLTGFMVLIIGFLYFFERLPPHLWIPFYASCGFNLWSAKGKNFPLKHKILSIILYFFISIIIIYFFSLFKNLPELIYNIKYFFLGALLPISIKHKL